MFVHQPVQLVEFFFVRLLLHFDNQSTVVCACVEPNPGLLCCVHCLMLQPEQNQCQRLIPGQMFLGLWLNLVLVCTPNINVHADKNAQTVCVCVCDFYYIDWQWAKEFTTNR